MVVFTFDSIIILKPNELYWWGVAETVTAGANTPSIITVVGGKGKKTRTMLRQALVDAETAAGSRCIPPPPSSSSSATNTFPIVPMNDDDDIIYIPNDKVYMSEIINYTKREIKKVSIDFELNLNYLTTIESLEKNLSESLKSFHQFIEPESFNIKIVDVHHDYLTLKFQYKLNEVNRDIERIIRKKTIRLIENSLKQV